MRAHIFKKAARKQFEKEIDRGCCGTIMQSSEVHGYYLQVAFENLYRHDSPIPHDSYWMGPHTQKAKEHRIMALLFAAEFYKGVRQ